MSNLQELLDKSVSEAEERGRRRGIAEERARIRDAIRRIDGVFVGCGRLAGVLVDGKIRQAFDGTLASALAEAIGLGTRP